MLGIHVSQAHPSHSLGSATPVHGKVVIAYEEWLYPCVGQDTCFCFKSNTCLYDYLVPT